MARRVFAWQCQYCGTLKRTELIAKRHEAACLHNPDAKNCILCVHSNKEKIEEDYEMFTVTKRVLRCSKRRINCSTAVSVKCEHFKNQYLCESSDDSKTMLGMR